MCESWFKCSVFESRTWHTCFCNLFFLPPCRVSTQWLGSSKWLARGGRRSRCVHFCVMHSQCLPKTVIQLRLSLSWASNVGVFFSITGTRFPYYLSRSTTWWARRNSDLLVLIDPKYGFEPEKVKNRVWMQDIYPCPQRLYSCIHIYTHELTEHNEDGSPRNWRQTHMDDLKQCFHLLMECFRPSHVFLYCVYSFSESLCETTFLWLCQSQSCVVYITCGERAASLAKVLAKISISSRNSAENPVQYV